MGAFWQFRYHIFFTLQDTFNGVCCLWIHSLIERQMTGECCLDIFIFKVLYSRMFNGNISLESVVICRILNPPYRALKAENVGTLIVKIGWERRKLCYVVIFSAVCKECLTNVCKICRRVVLTAKCTLFVKTMSSNQCTFTPSSWSSNLYFLS